MYVYVIKSNIKDKGIKIGSCKNLQSRLNQIKSGSSGGDETCHFLISIRTPEYKNLEKEQLHKFFDAHNKKYILEIKDTNHIEYKEWFDEEIINVLISYIYYSKSNNLFSIEDITIYQENILNKLDSLPYIALIDIKEKSYLSPEKRRNFFITERLQSYTIQLKSSNNKSIKKDKNILFDFYKNFEIFLNENSGYFKIVNYSYHLDNRINTIDQYNIFLKCIISNNIEKNYLLLKKIRTFDLVLYFEYIELYLHKVRMPEKNVNLTKIETNILKFCLKYKKDILSLYHDISRGIKQIVLPSYDKEGFEDIYRVFDRIEDTKKILDMQEDCLLILSGLLTDISYYEKRKQHVFHKGRKTWYMNTSIDKIKFITK